MIEPAKISYAKGEPSVGIRRSISFPFSPPPGFLPGTQRGQQMSAIAESHIYPL
jgi:hypothetical protein